MLIRALIVLLLALNLGVAGWWWLRAPPAAPLSQPLPPGLARLQLVGEGGSVGATNAAASAATTVPATALVATQCIGFGPFADATALAQARQQLRPLTISVVEREVYANPARAWRVFLPPFPDREAVEAAALRAAAAGFSDYFVVRDGDEAHSLALGRYNS
ncbi:MAG: SPOR domain-containing protein, partial [Pseudomonadota bacterium]|nr:SPOR domain-containing protein [Pseudomonadota bacterium]